MNPISAKGNEMNLENLQHTFTSFIKSIDNIDKKNHWQQQVINIKEIIFWRQNFMSNTMKPVEFGRVWSCVSMDIVDWRFSCCLSYPSL
jgi:hypothetical protein